MHSFASWVTHSWKRQETCMYCLFCLSALLLMPWFALQCLHSLPTRSICTRGVKSVLVALSAVFLHVIPRDVSVRVSRLASSVTGKVSSVRCWFLDPVVKSSYRLSSIKALRPLDTVTCYTCAIVTSTVNCHWHIVHSLASQSIR